MNAYAGDFLLATGVQGHSAETLVHVSVSPLDTSRLILVFSHDDEVLADACVLLCGSIGAEVLLELGYTGPLVRRPKLAAREEAGLDAKLLPHGADTARRTTEPLPRK